MKVTAKLYYVLYFFIIIYCLKLITEFLIALIPMFTSKSQTEFIQHIFLPPIRESYFTNIVFQVKVTWKGPAPLSCAGSLGCHRCFQNHFSGQQSPHNCSPLFKASKHQQTLRSLNDLIGYWNWFYFSVSLINKMNNSGPKFEP